MANYLYNTEFAEIEQNNTEAFPPCTLIIDEVVSANNSSRYLGSITLKTANGSSIILNDNIYVSQAIGTSYRPVYVNASGRFVSCSLWAATSASAATATTESTPASLRSTFIPAVRNHIMSIGASLQLYSTYAFSNTAILDTYNDFVELSTIWSDEGGSLQKALKITAPLVFGTDEKTTFGKENGMGIELYGATPYIDFHYSSSLSDYTARLICDSNGLNIRGGNLNTPIFKTKKLNNSIPCLVIDDGIMQCFNDRFIMGSTLFNKLFEHPSTKVPGTNNFQYIGYGQTPYQIWYTIDRKRFRIRIYYSNFSHKIYNSTEQYLARINYGNYDFFKPDGLPSSSGTVNCNPTIHAFKITDSNGAEEDIVSNLANNLFEFRKIANENRINIYIKPSGGKTITNSNVFIDISYDLYQPLTSID